MEQKIRALFDYQRFSPNERLADLIAETEQHYAALDDDALGLVAAAGDPDTLFRKQDQTE